MPREVGDVISNSLKDYEEGTWTPIKVAQLSSFFLSRNQSFPYFPPGINMIEIGT